jgi:hypothetical protein
MIVMPRVLILGLRFWMLELGRLTFGRGVLDVGIWACACDVGCGFENQDFGVEISNIGRFTFHVVFRHPEC